MSDQELFDQLFDTVLEIQLKQLAKKNRFQSIKDIKIYRKKVKVNWFFNLFVYHKTVRAIKFIIDEPQYVMESLMDNLSIKDFITPYSVEKYDVLEIYDEHDNEVV